MTEAQPLISAVVTTHNRLRLLPRALDSVAAQTYPNLELIVVDDGSDEDVAPVVESYRNKLPVRLIRHDKPLGACRARNRGIEEANGIFIAGLDDDDEWLPERIEKLYKACSENFSFVTSDVMMVYKNGSIPWKKKRNITYNDLLYSNMVGNQGLIKKEQLLEVGGFDESLKAAQDYDLWVRLSERFGPVRNVQQILQNVYLNHGGKRITNPDDQLRGYLQFYQKHKHKMSLSQRKYQLYTIRKATGKRAGLWEMLYFVPPHRFWKELKIKIVDSWFSARR